MTNATANNPVIESAEAAKRLAAEAAVKQQEAQEAQAKADAAELAARMQRDAARREWADATLAAHRDALDAANAAIKKAEAAFTDAVLSGKESGAAYARLIEARTDLYIVHQEKLSAAKIHGRDPIDRSKAPRPDYFAEVNRVLVHQAREVLEDKVDAMKDRREAFVTRKVGK